MKSETLLYQPQVCLATGQVIGAEVLLQCCMPGAPRTPPAELPATEGPDALIRERGRRLLRAACAQAAAWRAEGLQPGRIAIALAPQQWSDGDLTHEVQAALQVGGLPASALGLEITEDLLQQHGDRVADALRPLHADGVEVALAHYGTGCSSLARLRALPLDVLKIDRSFIDDIGAADSSASVSRSVIQLAHGLHLRVLADGVHTAEQIRLLGRHGCDRMQGPAFSPPLSAEAFKELLQSCRALPQELIQRRRHERTLLLVDDEEHILSALRRLVRRDGYKVLTANSGAAGLEILQREPVDVIVSDQRMPGMTGVEFLGRAKELAPATVRMTLSGYTDLQSIIDAVNEGAVYKFLTKPWDDQRLREHIAQAFRQRELVEENERLTHEVSVANTGLAAANRRLEHAVRREHDSLRAMQTAAGRAHDMVDLVPMAVLGFDATGHLVYANRCAVTMFPLWVADLGGPPDPALASLLASVPPDRESHHPVMHGGRHYQAWRSRVAPYPVDDGCLLMLRHAQA